MEMTRRVEPEWLDVLPPADPRAMRSRRDLERVNALMTNASIVADALRGALPTGRATIAEIGAGDGAFALRVARALPAGGASRFTLLDQQAIVSGDTRAGFERLGCSAHPVQADVFEWLANPATPRFDAVVANLFLHHFEADALGRMLAGIAERANVFVACEPRRSRTALVGSHLLGLIGCNDVTRHDAVASVVAGFHGRELSALWPASSGWTLEEGPRSLFSHLFVARRA
jgi:hypothetical protein